MENLIVEQQREYYPMTFYTDSLNKILNLSSNYQAEKIIFKLEPILVPIERVYFYSKLKSNQIYFGYALIILFLLSCFISILFDISKLMETALFLFNVINFLLSPLIPCLLTSLYISCLGSYESKLKTIKSVKNKDYIKRRRK